MPRLPTQRSDVPVELVWEAPPNPRDAPTIYDDALREVKASPGRWARIRLFPTQSPAYNSKKALQTRQKDPRWEFKVARIRGQGGEPDQHGLWVRYRTPEQMEEKKP